MWSTKPNHILDNMMTTYGIEFSQTHTNNERVSNINHEIQDTGKKNNDHALISYNHE